ncbi:WD40-repeat-containing domain protein [Phellopilus nigrolimitatus]|nr:WD40-repeat-containing domain protein [Phellopilus nigrolimitatus]
MASFAIMQDELAGPTSTNLCATPETCLGAPGLDDDFYSRLAAWSNKDLLAVAMRSSVVFRNMKTQTIGRVAGINPDESATCINWSPDSASLAVGNDCGHVRVYEPDSHLLVRDFAPHHEKDFVGDFSWKDSNVMTVGYQTGQMRQFDIRVPKGGKNIRSHKARICGVEWSPDGRFLATGGGDGIVVCWDARASKSHPLGILDLNSLGCRWRARKHLSTVKAMAWCPWSPDLLATGGGTKDGAIRFWDATHGRQKKLVINTNSQVTSLHFAPSCREIVSTHGYAFAASDGAVALPAPRRHSILVHSYPRGELTGKVFDAPHGRITHSCLSPDGTRLVTCGSDDSIRIYKVFGKQEVDSRVEEDMWSQSIIR